MNSETLVLAYKSFDKYKACLNRLGVHNEYDVEDIFHDSIVRLNEYRDDEVRNTNALLYRIIYTHAMEYHRKKVVTSNVEDISDAYYPYESVRDDEDEEPMICGKRMDKLLQNLTEREKNVLNKFVMEGKDFRTVSEEMGISEVNARVVWHRTKGKIINKIKIT